MTGLEAVQRAAFAALSAVPALSNRLYFGDAPQGAPGPYVAVADPTEIPVGVLGNDATENTITVHIWSATKGSAAEAFGLLSLVDDALRSEFAAPGRRTMRMEREFATTLYDGQWVHIPARYRVLTWQVSA